MVTTVLESQRLRLRPVVPEDAAWIFVLINDFEIVRNLSMVPWPYERGMADDFIRDSVAQEGRGTVIRRAITLKDDDVPVGVIDLRARPGGLGIFGYWIARKYWRLGYGAEALGAFVGFAFEELDMTRLGAEALPENAGSLGVLSKNGFSAGAVVSRERPNFDDTVMMREMWLDRADWEAFR